MRVFLLEILVDDGRIVDDHLVIDENRYLSVRIQLQKIGVLAMLARPQVDENLLVLQLFLGQYHAHLLSEGAIGVVVKLHHSEPPPMSNRIEYPAESQNLDAL